MFVKIYCFFFSIHSSANAKKWEIELQTLKNNNLRLTNALQESTANVDEWKRQLQSYKEENQRLKNRYLDAEVAKGSINSSYKDSGTFSFLKSYFNISVFHLKK